MTRFILETGHGNPWPEPGDVLENQATGNRWRILAVTKVRAQRLHPGYHSKWRCEVERVAADALPVSGGRLIRFERWRR